jgi:hypothetical protein
MYEADFKSNIYINTLYLTVKHSISLKLCNQKF